MQVTFLGVSKKESLCKNARTINEKANMRWECLEPAHFIPDIVETYPYEQLSHAVLNWFREDPDRCDVIHGHEWGGVFIDMITMSYLRQVLCLTSCMGPAIYKEAQAKLPLHRVLLSAYSAIRLW